MAKKSNIQYKNTLNDLDRFFIDHNPTMTVAQIVEKFENCSSGGKVPSPEIVEEYRSKYRDTNAVTTTNARSTMIKKGTSTVMTQAASEIGDTLKLSNKLPPYVSRIYRDK